ncbi:MAG TPA: autotransporter outer membrane beta-barrel domain-containing protein, partial [Roseomonas sp.]
MRKRDGQSAGSHRRNGRRTAPAAILHLTLSAMVPALAVLPLVSAPAFADGNGGDNPGSLPGAFGAWGGGGGGGGGGGLGGAGTLYPLGDALAGQDGQASGNGGAGATGQSVNANTNIGAGGAGGVAGSAGNPTGGNGGNGGDATQLPGGGDFGASGGGGGGVGFVGSSLSGIASAITGGNGGNGGSNISPGQNGDGGSGGGGGAGAWLTGSGSTTTQGNITGGNGGNGGIGFVFGGAGYGGGGGAALVSDGISVTNGFTILGGNGGNGGAAVGDRGRGAGDGGSGVTGTGFTLTNSGLVQGGNGGTTDPDSIWQAHPTSGTGGAGVAGTALTVINTGTIQGGNAGASTLANPGVGGEGIRGSDLIIVNAGSIIGGLGADGVAQANAIFFTGGTNSLELQPGWAFTGNVVGDPSSTNTLLLGGTAASTDFDVTQIGPTALFQGFSAFEKTGTGTWQLVNTTTELTPWTISGGTLQVSDDAALGAVAGALTINGGTLRITGTTFTGTTRDVILGANGGGIDIADAGNTFTLSQVLSGAGALEKLGAGTLILDAANTYTGGTTITGGVLAIAQDAAIGAASGPLTFNGGTLRLDSAFNLSAQRAISINAPGGTIDTNGFATTVAQGITGAGGLAVTGGGTLTLTGANTYAGGTGIAAATTLNIGNGGTTGSIVGDVLNNGTLAFNRSDAVVFTGAISGTGAVQQAGTGTTVLTANNTYTGGTTITAGTLQLGNGGTTGSIQGNVANNGALAFNRTDTVTFGGVISGTGAVRQDGSGTTILAAANTYAGPTAVNAGVLRAGIAGAFSATSAHTVAAGAELDLAGFNQTVGGLTNAGLVSLRGAPGTTLTVAGNYVGNGGAIALNTVLGGDNSATDRLVIRGGAASGDTVLRITNAGGPGAQTVQGIRVVETQAGGTTAAGAFRLDTRVVAGTFEYQLFRGPDASAPAGGSGGGSADDLYLRSFSTVPLYRPEVALYAPVAAIGRQMGLATLGTLHDRVGDEENIRDLAGASPYANGAWARAYGERTRNRWDGTGDTRATGDLVGFQAGFDILRTQPYAGGHRDHAGVYAAYTNYSAPSVSGFALGQQNLRVGRLSLEGPSVGAYWTHFGPTGWYVDAVFQASWYDITARSDYGTAMSTNATGYTASLEAGYPIRFGQGGQWQIEPQAQIIYQSMSVDSARDSLSRVDWNEDDAWTGRVGARLQYTGRDSHGTIWQPYAKLNLWHTFSGTDRLDFGGGAPAENRFGDTA